MSFIFYQKIFRCDLNETQQKKHNLVFSTIMSTVRFYCASLLSQNLSADAGFLCDKAALLGAATKERPCISN